MNEPKKPASVFPVTFVVGDGKAKKTPPKTLIKISKGCCVEKPKGGSK